jgi:hypothetical protein
MADYMQISNVLSASKKGPLSEEDRMRLRGWAGYASKRGQEVAELESPSGLSALSPDKQWQAAAFRSEQGVAKSESFQELANQLAMLAGTMDKVNNSSAKAAAELDKVRGTELPNRDGKPPAR